MMFKRENFEKKGIVRDEKSIAGVVDKTAKKIEFAEVLAYNHTTKKWVKYVKETHNTGAFLLGIAKDEIDVTSADKTIAILVRGEVARVDVKAVESDEALYSLLARQGLFLV